MKEVQGAEAKIRINGSVVKERAKKNYRHTELDTKIRKDRTSTEARTMKEARKNSAAVPQVEQTDDYTLKMEKIEGEQLKDVINDTPDITEELGRNTAKLHDADIIHGDLTTRNAIVSDRLYLIDFGLAYRSQRIEDRAVDIHLLKQVLESSHPGVAEQAWEKFVEGYTEYSKSEEVLERLEEVEKRGRYKT